jgi:PAS domain S-box-containing protein
MKSFSTLATAAILSVAILLFPGSGSTSGAQQENIETKRILMLYSYHEGLPWERTIDTSFRKTLASQSAFSIEINVEHTDRVRYADDEYRQKLIDMYQYKYSHPSMDLIIGIDDEAVSLLLDYGDRLFPGIPIVLITAERKNLHIDLSHPQMTSLLWEVDIRSNVELIGELLPQTHHIYIVAGTSPSDHEALKLAQESLREGTKRFTIHYLTDMSAKDLVKKVAQLPKQSAILYLVFSRDAEGTSFVPREILSTLTEQANVPVFGVIDSYLGYGIVGGNVLSAEMQGKRCAEIALHILRGESPGDPISKQMLNQLMFDWRQLKRWGISENKLPPESTMRFKNYSFWELYREYVVATVFLLLAQSGLISFLLKQRAQRRRAQEELAKRLRFEEMLAALSARFVNLPPDQVDTEIKAVLESIGKGLNADRVSIYEISEEDQKMRLAHSHKTDAIAAPPSEIQFEQIPWITQKLLNGEMLALSGPENLPTEAGADRGFLGAQGTISFVVAPLASGGKTLGALALSTLTQRKTWAQEILRQCRLVAEVFANALVRKQHEESLTRAENKYRTVADFTYDWEYWESLDGLLEYISPSCERITGYSAHDFMGNPSLLNEIIVPQDRDTWDRHFHDSRQKLKPCELQFRIQRRDGQIRWIEHNCQPVTDALGHLQGFRASNRDITARKEVEEAIRESEKDLRRLATQLISAHEEERRSLARELHDDLSQRLAALAIQAGRMKQQAVNKDALDVEAYTSLQDQIIAISNDVHSLSRQLHPSILDDLGLTRAVESECTRFANREGIEVTFTTENMPATLAKDVSLSIYRIIQEGLNNIAKHACARRAKVALQRTDGRLCLSIQDDGIGFDAAEVGRKPGLGLSSMRERTRIIHGVLRITSEPEKGTTISVQVPLDKSSGAETISTDSE